LAVMWTTYSSAYPQYYTPVNLTTSMTVWFLLPLFE
jgi:hypothetical protein